MQLSDVFLSQGEEGFGQVLRTISIGKLKTFQLFERFKTRAHLIKLNNENLRKSAPKLFARLGEGDQELATDISQAVLVSHFDMIVAVLDFLKIPHEEGFFVKDLDAAPYLTEGWQARVYEEFKDRFPRALLVFYINHMSIELLHAETAFAPAA